MLPHGCQASPPCGAEETIVTDLDEAFGQDMLQKPVQELFCVQGTTFFCASLSGAVAKRDAVIFQLQDPVVANGNPENVRSQILQRIQARADRLTVHNPLLLPNVRRNTGITIRVTQRLTEFAAEHLGERSHWQEEIVSCRSPALPIRAQATARDEIMHVRMVSQVAAPGVQHPHHPDLSTDPPWLLCQLLRGRSRCFEEQIVEQSLVRASHLIEAGWQGEGQQEVGNRQQQILLLLQPAPCIFILAFGAMAVAARVVTVLYLLTIWAAIDLSAQGCGAALFNRSHGFEVVGGHAAGILLAIGRTILAKDVCQFYGHRLVMISSIV